MKKKKKLKTHPNIPVPKLTSSYCLFCQTNRPNHLRSSVIRKSSKSVVENYSNQLIVGTQKVTIPFSTATKPHSQNPANMMYWMKKNTYLITLIRALGCNYFEICQVQLNVFTGRNLAVKHAVISMEKNIYIIHLIPVFNHLCDMLRN